MIRVELIRAWPGRFDRAVVELADGACVGDALACAGWALDGEFVGMAVFGQSTDTHAMLRDGDRVELLRPLLLDPKQARRLRASKRRQAAGTRRD